jgi:hypothetical protein
MSFIFVKKSIETLSIRWLFSKVDIPIKDILEVSRDYTYAGEESTAMRIGSPYGTTDRVVIKTKSASYILYTTNPDYYLMKICA